MNENKDISKNKNIQANQENEAKPKRMPILTARQIAKRIFDKRKDNIYKMEYLQAVIGMYMEECREALNNGERIQLKGIGMLYPKIKVYYRPYNLPNAYREDGKNPPRTAIAFTRNLKLQESMNHRLIKNVQSGYMGLGEKCMMKKQQITILKKSGYLDDIIIGDDTDEYDDSDIEDDDIDVDEYDATEYDDTGEETE